MKKKFSSEKGVTMITLALTIIVMMVILSVITFYVRNSVQIEQFQNMKADIEEIESKVLAYYLENKVLPIYSDGQDSKKVRSEMNGDSQFFNPNDGNEYARVNLDLIGVVKAYDTTYYVNTESLTVYAIDTVSINFKNYPRPADEFDKISIKEVDIRWEKECYEVPPNIFDYRVADGKAIVTGINMDFCKSNSYPEYYSDFSNWSNLIIPVYDSEGHPVKKIASGAFTNISLSGTLKIPSTVEKIESRVLSTNSNVKYIYINAQEIPLDLFTGCNSIKEIHFGSNAIIPSAEKAEQGLLYNKDSLNKVWIDTVSIGKYAFANCDNIQLLVLNDSITNIPEGCFLNITNNTLTILNEDNIADSDLDEEKYWPVGSSYNKGSLQWPTKLKTISRRAFYNSTGLKINNITNLDFSGCIDLTSIGDEAFWGINSSTSPEVILGEEVDYYLTSFPENVNIKGGKIK